MLSLNLLILPFREPEASAEGPVDEDDVPPLFRVQSNLSFLLCTKPHIDSSKLQKLAIDRQNK